MNTDHRRPTDPPPVCVDRHTAAAAFDLLDLLAVGLARTPDLAATMPAVVTAVRETKAALGAAVAASTTVADEPTEVTP